MRKAQHVRISTMVVVMTATFLAACGVAGLPPPPVEVTRTPSDTTATPSTGAATAAGDLDLLLARLEATHPQPFHGIPREQFVAALRDLQRRLPDLDAAETTVEVMRLVALLSRSGRDGHEFAVPQPGHEAGVLPLRLYEFDDGVFVNAAMAPYEALSGAHVTSVGSYPITDVLARIEPLVPRDGPATVPAFRPVFLLRTEVLRGLGIVPEGAVESGVRTAAGERKVTVEPVAFPDYVAWAGQFGMLQLPSRPGTEYLSANANVLWGEALPDVDGVYLRYTQVQTPTTAAVDAVRDLLAPASVRRVVLDLRQNPGGDNHNNPRLITLLTEFRAAHTAAEIVVITDRVTFSAAANLATDLERAVDPVFVGEPMGGGLNFWDDVTDVHLDHLPVPMQVGVSTRYWERSTPGDPRLTIEPDVRTPVTSADYFADRDPALLAAQGIRVP